MRIHIKKSERPSELYWEARKTYLRNQLLSYIEFLETFSEEQKPGGLALLRVTTNVNSDHDMMAFGKTFGFAICGKTQDSHTGTCTTHLFGQEKDLQKLLDRLLTWKMGQDGWMILPYVNEFQTLSSYAYPTDFPERYVAHLYAIHEESLPAYEKYVTSLGGTISTPRNSSEKAFYVYTTIDPTKLTKLRQYPFLHGVQGVHLMKLMAS